MDGGGVVDGKEARHLVPGLQGVEVLVPIEHGAVPEEAGSDHPHRDTAADAALLGVAGDGEGQGHLLPGIPLHRPPDIAGVGPEIEEGQAQTRRQQGNPLTVSPPPEEAQRHQQGAARSRPGQQFPRQQVLAQEGAAGKGQGKDGKLPHGAPAFSLHRTEVCSRDPRWRPCE